MVIALGAAGCAADAPAVGVHVQEIRPDATEATELPRFDPGDRVERYDSPGGAFAVHFTRAGRHAVPSTDDDRDGVPDVPQLVARTYDEVLARYRDRLGFRAVRRDDDVPDHGGDGRVDVYLVDFAGRADGAYRREACSSGRPSRCTGYLVQENDFAGYRYASYAEGVRTLASHELFHLVQAAYDAGQGIVLSEATAEWATERFDPALDDLERASAGYLASPERPLDQDPAGPPDGFSYGVGIFFDLLSRRHGDEVVRALWERRESSPEGELWPTTLDAVLRERPAGDFAEVFTAFATANLFTGRDADPARGWAAGARMARVQSTMGALPWRYDRVRLFRASARYYRFATDGRPLVRVVLGDASDGKTPPFEGVRVVVATRRGGRLDDPRVVTPDGGVAEADTSGAEELTVALVNTRTTGGSSQLSVCVGGVDECEAATADAGVAADVPTDASGGDAGGPRPAAPPSGCSCRTAPSSTSLAPLFALAVLLCARRRAFGVACDSTSTRVRRRRTTCRSTWRGAVLALSVALGARAVGAQPRPAPAPPAEEEQEIVVTGTRTERRLADSPVMTEVITRRDIEASGAEDLAGVLEEHPGMDVNRSNISGANLRIQGLDPQYVLILINGERMGGRVNGAVDLTRIPVGDIQRVEIVRGPSSALYGADAIGGVVNVITRRPTQPWELEGHARYGMLNTADTSLRGAFLRGPISANATIGYRHRDAFDLDPSNVATNGSTYDSGTAAGRFEWRPSRSFSLVASGDWLMRHQRGVDGGAGGAVYDRQNLTETFSVSLSPEYRYGADLASRVRFGAWFTSYRDQYTLDQRGSNALDQFQETRNRIGQLTAQVDQDLGRGHLLTVGAEGYYESLAADRLSTGTGDRQRGAVFVQDQWTLRGTLPRLVVVPGARLDVDSQFGAAPTPKLQVRFDPHRTVALRASYGWGFRAPSFQELLLHFENPGVGYVVEGNPDLHAETSRSVNLSVEWRPKPSLWLTANLYRNDIDDLIDTVLLPRGNPAEAQRYTYRNINAAWTMGVELSARIRPVAGVVFDVGYTFMGTRDLTNDRPLEGRAMHRVNLGLQLRHARTGLEFSSRAALVGPRQFYPATGPEMAVPYASVDVRAAWSWSRHGQVFVACDNVLDAGDPRFLLVPPRIAYLGVTLRR